MEAQMEKLKRMTLVIPKEGNDPALIAEKAHEILGYKGGVVTKNIASKLGKILIELDIKPYDSVRVKQYKEKQRKEAHEKRRKNVGSYTRVNSSWKQTLLSKYTRTVPDFVLRKAIQIKEACPEAMFFVDSLVVNTTTLPDPFLVVKLGYEKYWVEVWDEADFEAEL